MWYFCRDFLFHISSPKVVATNPRCLIKPQVLSDNSGPVVTFNLRKYFGTFIFKSNQLINRLYYVYFLLFIEM